MFQSIPSLQSEILQSAIPKWSQKVIHEISGQLCRYLLFAVGWFFSAHVAPSMASQTEKQLNEQSVRRCEFLEVDGVTLKCVYWITQLKDGSKGKNRPTVQTVGRRQPAAGRCALRVIRLRRHSGCARHYALRLSLGGLQKMTINDSIA